MAPFEDVAVVGISGLFPEAPGLDELHRNLLSGRDSVRSLPPERVEHTSVDPTLEYPTVGCLDRVDLFDHKFFNISLREAEYMDPHQRVTLELVCAAVENAGYSLASLRGTRTGVFLSAPRPEYYELFRDVDPLELLGNAPSALAGRISYVLDLQGPSLVLDAGCCGSLVAVDAACRDLFDGEARVAIAGGVALTVLFEPTATTAAFTEIMSPGGKCRAFDASADGTAAGEGGAVVVLKLLRHALEDGDHVHAVVKGVAVNQNGYRSNGLSAPSPAAQAEVIAKAWERADVDPSSIGYVEAHGSGTRLGDVIEVQGLAAAFRGSERDRPVRIGSVKTNVGHLDHAAGIAGMVKAILSLKHGTLYPSVHFETPNPLIDFEDTVEVQTEAEPWEPAGGPRRAGVSSFSLAGTNVHLVLEEAPSRPVTRSDDGPELVTVSAKSGAALRDYCRTLARFVAESEHGLAEIAAALNRGRDDHQVRAAAVVTSRDDLVSWLEATALGATGIEPVPREPRRLALLFSGDVGAPTDGEPSGLGLFRRHQALHSLARSLGLTETSVLGSGVGNLTVRTLLAGMDAEDAAREAATTGPSARVDVERLAGALDALGPDVAFLEMGGAGVLGRSVRAVRPDARVSALTGETDALTALAELYAAGVAIDWERFYEGRRIPRIEAPTYPFQRERCWCRPPGDYRRHGVEHAPDEVRALIETPETSPSGRFSTDTERALAGIWNEALKVEPEDASADYFDLGGTSITGMVVLDGVGRDFGVQISFQDLYECSRLDALAERIDALVPTAEGAGEPPIERVPRGGYLPVSFGQEQIWFLDQLEPGTPLYNIPFDLHLEGELDLPALRRALTDLARRHEVLRMGFVAVEGEPRAFVDAEPVVELPFVDLTSLPPDAARAEALRLFDEEATTPFDLSRPPLFRGRLVALAPGDHVLLMTFHHIVYDGWTPTIIQDELSALYGAAKEGRDAGLAPLPIQYPDFAHWQRQWMSGEVLERGLDFWREHLAGAPSLELPTDRPRPAVQSYSGDMVSLVIEEEVGDRLRELSRRESVTMFTTMMAAFNVLMARYSGQNDIVIGTPTSGRKKAETRGLIGYFNNMLPLRVKLDGDPTFAELMQRVAAVAARALDHDDIPFEKMVDALKPGRDLARNPLFQVAYSHQNAPQEGYELKDLAVSTYGEGDIRGIAPGTAKFDLTLGIGDAGEGELEGYLEYATDLFDRSTVEAMIAHLQTLLRAIAEAPETPVSRLPLVDPAERRALVERHNEPLPPASPAPFVHERVRAHAAADPGAVALVAGDHVLTYGELDTRAAAVAGRLAAAGVRRGDVVAVGVERSFDQVAAVLGALKAGAAYLPLDPSYPDKRLAFMVDDARPAALVADEAFAARVDAPGVPLVAVEGPADAGGPVPASPAAQDLAYVIYTSGSTGTPKPVGVTHANLAHLLDWHAAAYPAAPGERASTMAPLSFDASVWELWWPLSAGAGLVLVPDEVRADPDALVDTLERHEVAHAFVPTVLAGPLLARPAPRSLKTLFVGGDRLTARPPEGFGARVVNLYGPSEATVIATDAVIAPGAGAPGIGTPVRGARVYLLDDRLEPVPDGVAGEIYVGGRGVARGYLGRPGLTAERFVPDPFSPEPGARMYRSGDRGRYASDGSIAFLGRVDEQVKVRGYRVEPGEVEAALLSHPAIEETVVVLRGERLVAYVTGGAVPGARELRAFLRDLLPEHMVPGAFVALDALPVTPGGKVDRAALPEARPEAPAPEPEIAYEAPATPVEETLAAVWAEVLGVARIGRDDNFFDLGGDSILSIQIVARAAARGVKLLPKNVFEAQTVAELARLAGGPAGAGAATDRRPVTGPVPMTPIQRWFFEQDLAEPHHFNQAMLLELGGVADERALRAALTVVTEQHDVLRTRWQRDGLGWRGVVAAAEEADLLVTVDLSRHDPATTMLEMERAATAIQSSFDLQRGPLVRAGLFDFGPLQPPQVLLAIHHLVVDAISWGSLVHDLGAAYSAIVRGRAVELPAKTSSFQEWARHLEQRAGELDQSEKAMWTGRLSGLEPALLRRDGDGVNDVGSTDEVSLELDEARSLAVTETLVRDHGLQPNETLLAALGLALGKIASGRHLVVDVEGHGREPGESGLELSRTAGWFTTIYPVVLEPGAGAAETLGAARDQMRDSKESGIGYGLLRYLGTPEDAEPLRTAPQAEVSFNYLGRFEGSLGGGGDLVPAEGPLGLLRSPAGARRHLIEAEAWVGDDRVRMDLVYSRHVHDRATIDALRAAFHEAVDEVVAAAATLAERDEGAAAAALLAAEPGVETAFPLTPMQQGLLFHTLYEPGGTLYFEQLVLTLEGDLDHERFERAWQRVAARHPLLGAAAAWEGIEEPALLVPADPRVEVTRHDLRGRGDGAVEAFLAADRERGLDLAQQLTRVAVLRVADGVHRVVWSHHHLLLDGWSVQLLLDEVLEVYERGDAARLEAPGDYHEFVQWLRARDAAESLDWWRSHLAGFDAPTDLRLVPPERPGEGHGMVQRALGPDETEAASAFARARRVTMSTLVEAAWAATLSVYAGTRDVVFGAIVSGRSAPVRAVEHTAGLFINTVPVRIELHDDAPVGEWLTALQKGAIDRRDHEHAPLVDVQQVSDVPPQAPLFHTLIAYENYPIGDVWDEEEGSLRISGAPTSENTNYPISLVIAPGDGLTFRLSYDRSKVTEETATALVERFAAMLRLLAADADRPVASLSALTESDRATLARLAGTRAGRRNELLVHEMFEAQATRTPDVEAVACGPESVTYAELDARAGALAGHLRDLGVGPDVLVAICCERTVAMVAAMLAVLKAGGAYVPVDPRYPAERISFMLADTAAPVLLTERHLADRVPAGAAKVVLLDATGNGHTPTPPATARRATDGNLAYVLYTSGSTGRPKGIAIAHRSVTAFLDWATETWGDDLKVVMACTSMSFDVHVFEIFATLCSGGTVLLVDDALAFTTLERRDEMTLLNAVPSAVEELIQAGPLPPGIRTINLPGEPLSRKLVERVFAASSAERIVNLYGPTEDTTYSTAAFLVPGETGPPSIGRPIAGSWIYLLDRNLEQVPPGVPGEVYIGGAGLARGYFGRPGMTAERFLPDALAPEPGARMYKTGDLARYRADGSLDFMGRLDYQIKIRGFRVELGEIEQGLLAHPGVRHAVVVTRDASPGGRRMVAYAVPEEGAGIDADRLRAHLAARLPDYMVPSAFVLLDALPLNPNGKVDRAALPEPGSTRTVATLDGSEPATATERVLASIWRELLEVDDVRRDDSFFELGGQSLLATRLVSRIRETWGVDARLRVVFDAPSLVDLASRVAELCGGQEEADAIASTVAEIGSLSEDDVKRMLAQMEGEGD